MQRGQQVGIPASHILPCDGDPTIRQGDWLRLCDSPGICIAHDVWVGVGGVVYENSGPGGGVRRNTLQNVLAGRRFIIIVKRTPANELLERTSFAEEQLGTPWAGFYTCQDFASEVATGRAESFQRDAVLVATALIAGTIVLANTVSQPPRYRRRRLRQ